MKEELKIRGKTYQENKIEKKLPLDSYGDHLKKEISRKISGKIDGYISKKMYDDAVKYAGNFLNENSSSFYELPLKNIIYELPSPLILGRERQISENRLIINEKTRDSNLLNSLKEELETSEDFIFIVSFLRFSGLQLLISMLRQLEEKDVKGRILTSVYMSITEEKALRKLLDFKNIEVRIYNSHRDSFHTKSYIFKRENSLGTFIIGSSNISHQALLSGEEWNVKLSEESHPNIMNNALDHFEKLWNSEEAVPLSESFLESYKKFIEEFRNSKDYTFDFFRTQEKNKNIEPNSMQRDILKNLKTFRNNGKKRAVVVAATGTGKTFLAAFDTLSFNPQKLLFIAHREEILRKAAETFRHFFPSEKIGLLTGTDKNHNVDFLFATVQSLSREKTLRQFDPEKFQYIVVDEFHHSAADSYKKVIDYFQSEFLLGLTATPERMDGKDILEICDYNLAGEVRLKEALEREFLAPFHYFGISDDTVDYGTIPLRRGNFVEEKLSIKLSINARVDFISKKITEYLFDGKKMCALGFCTDKNHALFMENEFVKKGYRAKALLAENRPEERERNIKALEKGSLDIIFAVDIFNEGIDIPSLNLLLFLRPTESPTIFIQQLGRGLRKNIGKNFVTVLDFIGNHNKAFTGALALSRELGENSRDKEILERNVKKSFPQLPGNSFVEFDKICQKKILSNIEGLKYCSKEILKEDYTEMRKRIGRPLVSMDFLYEKEEEKFEIIIRGFGCLHNIKKSIGDLSSTETEFLKSPVKSEILERIDNMIPVKRPHEILVLKELMKNSKLKITTDQMIESLSDLTKKTVNSEEHRKRFSRAFRELEEPFKKQNFSFGILKEGNFVPDRDITLSLEDEEFKIYLNKKLEYAFLRFQRDYSFSNNPDTVLSPYKNYSRTELQILLDSHAQKGSWRAGYSIAGNNICLFITMEKEKGVEKHLNYDNYFEDQKTVQWISQNKTSHSSKIGQLFTNHLALGMKAHIFIRRSRTLEKETRKFTYLGEALYHNSHGDKPMHILWKLIKKIPDNIFLDLTI